MPIYLANSRYNSSLTTGYTHSPADTVLNVGSVPSNLPTIVVVARNTVKETWFTATSSAGGNQLTGVARLRGANVSIDAGAAVECINSPEFLNQYAAAVFSGEGLKPLIYGADAGSTDAYAITLSPVPTSYTALIGVPINFIANTANTGAATLNVNSLGAKTIKKLHDQDLADNDIEAGQMVTVVYDGTNFQMMSPVAASSSVLTTKGDLATYSSTATRLGVGTNGYSLVSASAETTGLKWTDAPLTGWTEVQETWTYASATTITVPAGAASRYSVGDRVKLTQTTPKYFYIVTVADTLLTVTGGTDYTVANAAITSPLVSHQETPVGFPTWFSFTPTWTATGGSPAFGSATVTCKFAMVGKMVSLKCKILFASTTFAGTEWRFSLPIPAVFVGSIFDGSGAALLYDASGVVQVGVSTLSGSTIFGVYPHSTTLSNAIGSTTPFTWANSDILMVNLVYEAV